MPEQPVLELLTTVSRAKLRTMQLDIDAKLRDLQTQRQWIDRALAAKGEEPLAAHGSGSQTPANPRTGTNAIIREILAERPGYVWTPAEIINQAQARGVTSSAQAIRVALRRMGEPPTNLLARGPDGTGWRLASSNGSGGESSSEAPISGSREYERQSSRIGNLDLGASDPGLDA
jgi:hypothetical protein